MTDRMESMAGVTMVSSDDGSGAILSISVGSVGSVGSFGSVSR